MKKPPEYYQPQYTVPGQMPSLLKAYDPRIQPDQYANRDKVGAKALRYVPEGLADTGDPLYQRTDGQRFKAEAQKNLSYLGASDRSITATPSGVYALFSADGTPQDIPGEENFVMVGTFPLGYDPETRTYFPDTTGTAGPSTSVTVSNPATNGAFVQPATGAVFSVVQVAPSVATIANTPASPVPVDIVAGSLPSSVTVNNDVATEGVPVVNQTGTELDVNISSTTGNLPVAVQGTVGVAVQGTPNVNVSNLVTAQIQGTVSTTQGGPVTIPGANVTDATALPTNIALVYGREGTNTNTPIAVNASGAVLTSSVGTSAVDGTITIDNTSSAPVPTVSQDAKAVAGSQLGAVNGLVTTAVIYAASGVNSFDTLQLDANGNLQTSVEGGVQLLAESTVTGLPEAVLSTNGVLQVSGGGGGGGGSDVNAVQFTSSPSLANQRRAVQSIGLTTQVAGVPNNTINAVPSKEPLGESRSLFDTVTAGTLEIALTIADGPGIYYLEYLEFIVDFPGFADFNTSPILQVVPNSSGGTGAVWQTRVTFPTLGDTKTIVAPHTIVIPSNSNAATAGFRVQINGISAPDNFTVITNLRWVRVLES